MMKDTSCVRVRALKRVLAPVGTELTVSKAEAAALVAMGNAEIVSGGTYERSDMRADGGVARKHRR
jgi:hypothetical protein